MEINKDLLQLIRNERSKILFEEVIASYEAGAYRATLVSAWVAVAVDLIDKIKSLAEAGDSAARAYNNNLTKHITSKDKAALATLERDLLKTCKETFSLISDRDLEDLERLRKDRHMCAHPAFIDGDAMFSPSMELCAHYLSLVMEAVLKQKAVTGKIMNERFEEEIQGENWLEEDNVENYLREQYFTTSKMSSQSSLSKLIVSTCINPPEDSLKVGNRARCAAIALSKINIQILREGLDLKVNARALSGKFTDIELFRAVAFMGELAVFWEALPDHFHSRAISSMRATCNTNLSLFIESGILQREQANPKAQEALNEIVLQMNDNTLAGVLKGQATEASLKRALLKLSASKDFDESNVWLKIIAGSMLECFTPLLALEFIDILRKGFRIRNATLAPLVLLKVVKFFGSNEDVQQKCRIFQEENTNRRAGEEIAVRHIKAVRAGRDPQAIPAPTSYPYQAVQDYLSS